MRMGISALLALLGGVLLTAALVAGWTRDLVLKEERWTAVSVAVVQDPAVREIIAEQLADALVASPAVQRRLEGSPIPGVLRSAATGVLRNRAREAAETALERGTFDRAWEESSVIAHGQVIRWLEGTDVERRGDKLILDLRPALRELAEKVNVPPEAAALSPASKIELADADRYDKLRDNVRALELLAGWGIPAALLLLLAATLIPRSKARGLLMTGIALMLSGLAILAALRGEVRDQMITALADGGTSAAVSGAVWDAAAPDLAARGWLTLAAGLLLSGVAAAWIRVRRPASPAARGQRPRAAGPLPER